jgi:hypothetical protein
MNVLDKIGCVDHGERGDIMQISVFNCAWTIRIDEMGLNGR